MGGGGGVCHYNVYFLSFLYVYSFMYSFKYLFVCSHIVVRFSLGPYIILRQYIVTLFLYL